LRRLLALRPALQAETEKIARDSALSGDNAGAQEQLERAIKILEKDPAANPRLLSWCLTSLGIRKFEMNDYAGALEQSERALAIKEKSFGTDDPDVSLSMNNVGWILMKMKRFDEAQPILERAVDIAQRAGPRLATTGLNLGSLGELWWRRGEPSKAKPYLEQSVHILRPLDAAYPGASLHLLSRVAPRRGHPTGIGPGRRLTMIGRGCHTTRLAVFAALSASA
jgi:tetratricopeptide (TPR) repeat protein